MVNKTYVRVFIGARGLSTLSDICRVICMRCGDVTPREPFQARLAELNPEAAAAVARAAVSSDAAARLVDPGEDGGLQVGPDCLLPRWRGIQCHGVNGRPRQGLVRCCLSVNKHWLCGLPACRDLRCTLSHA